MGEPFTLQWGEIRRSINAVKERLENPKPVLREFSKGLAKDIKQNIAAGGVAWPPYAESTRKRMEATGTSQVSRRGTIRSDRVKRTAAQITKLEKKVIDEGWTPANRKKAERLKRRLVNYQKAEALAKRRGEKAASARATLDEQGYKVPTAKEAKKRERAQKQLQDATKDRLGKRQSQKRKLLERMPGTIRNRFRGQTLVTYSKADEVGQAHNAGEGRDPKREFIPPPDMERQIERLAELMESDLGQAWDRGSS